MEVHAWLQLEIVMNDEEDDDGDDDNENEDGDDDDDDDDDDDGTENISTIIAGDSKPQFLS